MDELGRLFRQAAFDGSWEAGLGRLADLCGGHAAELIGVGAESDRPFYRAYNLDPDGQREFIAREGGDPRRNARVRVGVAAPLLQPMTEADFGDLDAVLESELYADLFTRFDIALNLQTTLMRGRSGVIGLAVLHSRRHGLASADEVEMFARIAPHVQDAVRLRLALEGQGVRVLNGTLDALSLAAFVCTADGRVRSLTPRGQALVEAGAHLTVRQGRLEAAHPQDHSRFERALRRAAVERMSNPRSTELVLRSPRDSSVLVCEIAPLPAADFPFGFAGAVLVIARQPRSRGVPGEALQQAFGLTAAECQIAIAISEGRRPADLARDRGVSIATVRSQLKAVAAKLGVSRQAEIAALVASLHD